MRWKKKIGNALAPVALAVGKKSMRKARQILVFLIYLVFLTGRPSWLRAFKEFTCSVSGLSCGKLLISDPQSIMDRGRLKLEKGEEQKKLNIRSLVSDVHF